MTVVAEKSEEFVFELRVFGLVRISLVPFHIVVQKMDGFRLEELSNFRIIMEDVSEMYFIDFRIDGFVSQSGPEEHPGQDGEAFESEGEVPELIEAK